LGAGGPRFESWYPDRQEASWKQLAFFIMPYFYILHSSSLDKYYVGHTSVTVEERLQKHLSNHNGFTAKAKDWVVAYAECYDTTEEAHKREIQVKRWKSRKKIELLISEGV
jgi:putative endonuclease